MNLSPGRKSSEPSIPINELKDRIEQETGEIYHELVPIKEYILHEEGNYTIFEKIFKVDDTQMIEVKIK